MESDHYTIPGYRGCLEQASTVVRHELDTLQQLQREVSAGRHPTLATERLEAMVAWRRTLLSALAAG